MPSSALRPCTYPGCSSLVLKGRCPLHPYAISRDADRQKLYNTARWKQLRMRQLSAHPWCEECLRAGIYVAAVDVDHVIPHRGDEKSFFSGRLQSLCKACHSRKTAAEVGISTQGVAKKF